MSSSRVDMADVSRPKLPDILNGNMTRHLREDVVYSVKRWYVLHKEGKHTEWRDLEYYYSILTDKDIPNYRTVFGKLALEQFPSKYRPELFEYMLAAHERYEQALFARDIIDKLVKKTPDNTDVFLANFHTWYFIVIIKALGDNLAWIVNYFYNIGLESSPNKIDLNNKEFRTRLFPKKDIFGKICEGSGYEEYKNLTEFRLVVVHRHALGLVQVLDKTSRKRIMIPRDPLNGVEFQTSRSRTKSKYEVSRDRASIAKYGRKRLRMVSDPNKDHENLVPFCSRHLSFIADSYKAVLAEMATAQ
jgi:hypothetical protein